MPETPNFTPDIEAAAQRIQQTSERVLALSKENGLVWLEAYEKMLNGVLKLEEDTAKELKVRLGRDTCVHASRPRAYNVAGIPQRRQGSPEVVPPLLEGRPPGLG